MQIQYKKLDPIDVRNKNRRIDTFSDEECWDYFRFRKYQLKDMTNLLNIPVFMIAEDGTTFPGEHALLVYLYHLSYPTKLQRMQSTFGREYSQISRIENTIKSFLIINHRNKIVGNFNWYEDRLDLYKEAYNSAISRSNANLTPGTIPNEIRNICGSLDGVAFPIARIHVSFFVLLLLLLLLL